MAERRDILWRFLGDSKNLTRGTKKAEKSLGGMAQKGVAAAGALGVAFGAREILQFGADSITAASDYGESMNAVEVSTGDAATKIFEIGETAAQSMGLSRTEVNEAAVAFAGFAKKIDAEDVGGKFDEFSLRATDFASVLNLETSDALRIFSSTLAGETEPIRKFGLDLSAAAVSAHAVATGVHATGKNMTESEKVRARYSLLMEETAQFQGDFARTSDDLAGSMKIANAEFANAKIALGEELIPLQLEWVKVQRRVVIPALEEVVGALGVMSDSLEVTGEAWGTAADDSEDWGTRVTGAAEGVAEIMKTAIGGVPGLFFDWRGASDEAATGTEILAGKADELEEHMLRLKDAGPKVKVGLDEAGEGMDDLAKDAEDAAKAIQGVIDKMRGVFSGNLFGDAFDRRQFEIDLLRGGGVGSGQTEMHSGGVVPGRRGTNTPIMAQAGERISPLGGGGGQAVNVVVNMGVVGDPYQAAQVIRDLLTQGETGEGTRISGVSV